MIKPDPALEPEWDDDNLNHIAGHGLNPEQVKEVYYSEGPYPTLAIKNKRGNMRGGEDRYRLWGTDEAGFYIEAIVAPYSAFGCRRCVTAFPLSTKTRKIYLKREKK